MTGLVEWLEQLGMGDPRVRAVLRRSLAFDPGTYVPSYPYVERFLSEDAGWWRRTATYLIAGLWASQWREGMTAQRLSLATVAAARWNATGSPVGSTEQRFISLLAADQEQLPYRLRQMVALLKDYPIDFDALLTDLIYWNDDQRRVQSRWAREFYRLDAHNDESTPTDGTHR